MARYILKRFLLAIPTFIGATLLVFLLANTAPGNPVDVIDAMGDITPEMRVMLEHEYGLDKPVIVRYGEWLSDFLHGDMGTSTRVHRPVWEEISDRIAPTLMLTVTSLIVCLAIAIPLGILSAVYPGGMCDRISTGLTFLGTSMPGFFLCLVLIYIFAVRLNLLPTSGMYTNLTNQNLPDLARHMLMPVAVSAFGMLGSFIKQTRGSMLEVMNEEYVKTARAKGLLEPRVVILHIFRNALIPVVTCIGMSLPRLVSGSVVVEKIFNWPGLGMLMTLSISNRDYTTITSVTALIAIVVLVVNLLLDFVYAFLDPRIARDMNGGN